MTPREHFTSIGRLYECPNPPHDFAFGRVLGTWRWARECWSDLTDRGSLTTHFIDIGTIENAQGTKGLRIVIWRFMLLVGIA